MPTTYSDQFFLMDPANPPSVGTTLTVSVQTLTDQNDDGDIDRFDGDAINGVDIVNSWPGDTVTINVPGVGDVTYTGITFYLAGGVRVFTPTDGSVLQEGTLVSTTFVNSQGPLDVGNLGPPCFGEGTVLETVQGGVAVEHLRVGDLVLTRDNGPQAVRWIGRKALDAGLLRRSAKLRPIRIRAGALSGGVPAVDLIVSPQHRVLVRSTIAERMFGDSEVLVAAKHLCGVVGIEVAEDLEGVVYFHLLFDRHEVVISNGAETESLHTGPEALKSVGAEALEEIFTLFPELRDRDEPVAGARGFATGRRGRKLAERHGQNGKPLVTPAG